MLARILVSTILVSLSALAHASSPQQWFDDRGWDTSDCEVEQRPVQSSSSYFSVTLINPFSTDIRLGYWREGKSDIRIYGAQQPNSDVKWRLRDWDKFYVLDVVNRKCVNDLRFTYADEGTTVLFSRGMNSSEEMVLKKDTSDRTKTRTAKKNWKPGDCVEGDCQNGIGTRLLSRGNKVAGEHRNGKANGYAAFLDSDGDVCEGEWKNGSLHGIAVCRYSSGSFYFGFYERGRKQGDGFFITETGEFDRVGFWKNGKLEYEFDVNKEFIEKELQTVRELAPLGLREKIIPSSLLTTKPSDFRS